MLRFVAAGAGRHSHWWCMSSSEKDAQRARAEGKFRRAEEVASAGASMRAEQDAQSQAVDDNSARLKALRLARDAAAEPAAKKPARGNQKPES